MWDADRMTSQQPADVAAAEPPAVPETPILSLPPSAGGLSRSRRWAGLLVAAVGLPLLTVAMISVRTSLAIGSVLLIYLLTVVLVAVIGGVAAALLAAVASFLLVNWFLTPPYHTFAVENRNAVIDLVVFVLAAIVVSVTVELGARNREHAERTRIESRLISEISGAEITGDSLLAVLEQVRGLFGMSTVALVDPSRGDVPLASVGPDLSSPATLLIDTTNGLQLAAYGPQIFGEDRRLLGVLAAMASRAWQGQQLSEQAGRAQQLAQTDRVRSALLAAVSHDLRTPLAGIKVAVSSLRQEDISWTLEEQRELLLTVEESADRLTDLISNLLAMSRIQAGAVSVHIEPVALDEVVARALLGSEANVTVDVAEDLPMVQADAGLLERVVANLVDNARRFNPPGTPVWIHVDPPRDGHGQGLKATSTQAARVCLHITDHGPGIATSQWESMFEPFQRVGDHDATSGLGLGLAISQGFTEAMHAELTPSATPGGGLTMTITLPAAR